MSHEDFEKWEAKLDTPLPGHATADDDLFSGADVIRAEALNTY